MMTTEVRRRSFVINIWRLGLLWWKRSIPFTNIWKLALYMLWIRQHVQCCDWSLTNCRCSWWSHHQEATPTVGSFSVPTSVLMWVRTFCTIITTTEIAYVACFLFNLFVSIDFLCTITTFFLFLQMELYPPVPLKMQDLAHCILERCFFFLN